MAKQVLRSAKLTINGTDLSDHCSSVAIEDEAEDVDVTSFNAALFASETTGFKDVVITATFFQDYAANEVHRILQPLYDAGSPFDISVLPDGSLAPSNTNPVFIMTARMYGYSPLAAAVGDAVDFDVEFRNASPYGLTTGGDSYSTLQPTTLLRYTTMMLP